MALVGSNVLAIGLSMYACMAWLDLQAP